MTEAGPSRRQRLRREQDQGQEDSHSVFDSDDGSDLVSTDEYEDIDPNEFDLMLSRSVQSAGAGAGLILEPEPVEYSMLRNTRRRRRRSSVNGSTIGSRSRSRRSRRESNVTGSVSPSRTRKHRRHSAFGQQEGGGGVPTGCGQLPDEETPLLLPSLSHDGSSKQNANVDGAISERSSASSSTYSAAGSPDLKSTAASPYLSGVSPARFWVLFIGIMITYFVACFDSTIMASSHPVITSYFGSSNSASWLSTAFLLTSTSFQPLLGGLSDAVGRKQPYVVTMTIFLLATLWCALAQSMTSFILARAVCGLGAGGMMTLGSIMVSDLVPIEIRGAYQSYINITFGVGAMLGAGLGGAMADFLGWRWEFGVQVPLLVGSLVVAVTTVPPELGLDGKPRQGLGEAMKTFDFKGSFLMSTSVTFLILGLVSFVLHVALSLPFRVIISYVTGC